MWRVFWVPQGVARTGIGPRVLAGWENLPTREKEAGVRAGDPILLSPDHRVDALLSLYFQSSKFRRYRAETRRNYAQDIALLLTFLWGRGRAWTEAVERDLEDYEHWRRFAPENPERIGGSKWDRELEAFVSLYQWATAESLRAREPGGDEEGPRSERGR
jgi:site-specific recombinase XerD